MAKKPEAPKPELPPTEITLDFLKYNVYLLFKAVCAQVVVQTNPSLKEPKDIAIEADRLAQYLQAAPKAE